MTEKIKAADFEYVFAYFNNPIKLKVEKVRGGASLYVPGIHKPIPQIYLSIHIVWYVKYLLGNNHRKLLATLPDYNQLAGVI